jgi:hypothetical protein
VQGANLGSLKHSRGYDPRNRSAKFG